MNEARSFFFDSGNQPSLAADCFNLQITFDLHYKMCEGMIDFYKVHPIPGIPINGVTAITTVKELIFFIDQQRFRTLNSGIINIASMKLIM